jgi:hypothetical protein
VWRRRRRGGQQKQTKKAERTKKRKDEGRLAQKFPHPSPRPNIFFGFGTVENSRKKIKKKKEGIETDKNSKRKKKNKTTKQNQIAAAFPSHSESLLLTHSLTLPLLTPLLPLPLQEFPSTPHFCTTRKKEKQNREKTMLLRQKRPVSETTAVSSSTWQSQVPLKPATRAVKIFDENVMPATKPTAVKKNMTTKRTALGELTNKAAENAKKSTLPTATASTVSASLAPAAKKVPTKVARTASQPTVVLPPVTTTEDEENQAPEESASTLKVNNPNL